MELTKKLLRVFRKFLNHRRRSNSNLLFQLNNVFDVSITDKIFNMSCGLIPSIKHYCQKNHGVMPDRVVMCTIIDSENLKENAGHMSQSDTSIRIEENPDGIVAIVSFATEIKNFE